MHTNVYEMTFAGHVLRYSFLYPRTRLLFRPIPRPVDGEEFDIRVSPERISVGRNFLPADSSDEYVEYRCLIELTARTLLRYDCCILHAASFVWRDRAWLLTAPPGTGKTTQFLNWQRLFPDEVVMISGDMPVLESRGQGGFWVHPSSWNGKEKLFSQLSAPLGGLVLLQQGKENRIEPLDPREGVAPILAQFPVVPETEEEILRLARMEELLLQAAPAWKFVNLGDDVSTALLRSTFMRG